MSKCPSCGDLNAYNGCFGWSCIVQSCRNFDKMTVVNNNIIIPQGSPTKEYKEPTSSKYDRGSHFDINVPFQWWNILEKDKIGNLEKCQNCQKTSGSHRGYDGKCPDKPNWESDTYYKHPKVDWAATLAQVVRSLNISNHPFQMAQDPISEIKS